MPQVIEARSLADRLLARVNRAAAAGRTREWARLHRLLDEVAAIR